ncbi:hypothetical protein Ahy_A09g046546 [Arachis hypogaea]|uniref:Uncharacterized protein n=1 Tax=Arachis hypogaea TaxID=3818 RepID=A0A445BQ45_ARAHY|nr:hypothetical protein Ahy_A09g046546 [Arachis hypogaea]
MSTKQGGKAKPLKKPKSDKKDYDEVDMANIQKKKEEEKYHAAFSCSVRTVILFMLNPVPSLKQALKELKAKAQQKGSFGGSGLKKSGKK